MFHFTYRVQGNSILNAVFCLDVTNNKLLLQCSYTDLHTLPHKDHSWHLGTDNFEAYLLYPAPHWTK